MKRYCAFIISVILLSACSSNNIKISGRFAGCGDQMIYLEKMLPGSQTIEDSIMTDNKGNFKFRLKLSSREPTIYMIKHQDDALPLLLSPGDKVKISSIGNVSLNYTLTGSPGSARMRELKMLLWKNASTLDSILNVYAYTNEANRQQVEEQYMSLYRKAKRDHIAFIASDPGSVASIYALYQRFPNDPYLANGTNDIMYYRMVADSAETTHPNSPYLKTLRSELSNVESSLGVANMINEKLQAPAAKYPDLDLPDILGNKHKLSSQEGKVVLIDFWASSSTQGRLNNAELKNLYSNTADLGFEIYQISVDTQRAAWMTAVREQNLPWITVSDLKGSSSPAVLIYNVRNVPSNYLLDRNGNIAGKDLYGDALVTRVNQLLK